MSSLLGERVLGDGSSLGSRRAHRYGSGPVRRCRYDIMCRMRERSETQVQRATAKERLAAFLRGTPRTLEDIRGFLERHSGRPIPRRTAERYRDWMCAA